MKDIQATGEASSPQKRKFTALKQNIFSLFVVHFCPSGSGNADPAYQNHSGSGSATLVREFAFIVILPRVHF